MKTKTWATAERNIFYRYGCKKASVPGQHMAVVDTGLIQVKETKTGGSSVGRYPGISINFLTWARKFSTKQPVQTTAMIPPAIVWAPLSTLRKTTTCYSPPDRISTVLTTYLFMWDINLL